MNKSTYVAKAWIGAALAAIALGCVRPAVAQIGVVQVTGGRVEGVTTDGVTSFKGIPFAAPPVGDLRWRDPQPVKPWDGVKKADHFGPQCMQGSFRRPGAPPVLASEDCLYLNVWTTASSADAHLPVMVWLYGGSFMGGAGSQPAYDGTHLAQKGVVLVNLNYRLGMFGFLADRELEAESPHHVSGNYGLSDMIAALQWVKANAAQFGGDPSRVTVFGESAGALGRRYPVGITRRQGAVPACHLRERRRTDRPTATGRCNLQPGGTIPNDELGRGRRPRPFSPSSGPRTSPPHGRCRQTRSSRAQPGINPVEDGYLLPANAYQRFRSGRFNSTPILVGTNSDEGGFRPFKAQFNGTTPDMFEAHVRAAFGKYADKLLAAYPHATADQARQASEDLFFRETALAWKTWAWARFQAQAGHDKAYLYYFDRRTAQEPLGPVHVGEVPYVFGSVGQAPSPGSDAADPSDVTISQQMQSYWVNFAKSGDPNGPGLPDWPAFSTSSQKAMYLDAQSHAGPVPNLDKLEVLDAYFRDVREQEKK